MWQDPIVEEVHKIRREHAAKFNFDLREIVKYYQKQQKRSGRKVVSFAKNDRRAISKLEQENR